MGLTQTTLKVLIRHHADRSFQGPVITLGNQDIWADYQTLKGFFRDAGVVAREPRQVEQSKSALLARNLPLTQGYVHARTLFGMMGIEDYEDMDLSDCDGATFIHDLNEPVPARMHQRYGLVLDGGTTEHVFDVRQVLENVVSMVRVGGHVLHVSPMANYVNHGFYSFSPDLFFDFYAANGFVDMEAHVLSVVPAKLDHMTPGRVSAYHYGDQTDPMIDPDRRTLLAFVARREADLGGLRIPQQCALAHDAEARRRTCRPR